MVEKNVEGKDLERKVATEISVQVDSREASIRLKRMMGDKPLNLYLQLKISFQLCFY